MTTSRPASVRATRASVGGGEDDVERDEQEGTLRADVQQDPEGRRGEQRDGPDRRIARQDGGEAADDGCQHHQGADAEGAVDEPLEVVLGHERERERDLGSGEGGDSREERDPLAREQDEHRAHGPAERCKLDDGVGLHGAARTLLGALSPPGS